MKRGATVSPALGSLHVMLALLLVPALIEAVDPDKFALSIQGIPLSVGRIAFILSGCVALVSGGSYFLRTGTFKGLLVITAGAAVGAAFSDDLTSNLTRTLAFGMLVVGACGIAYGWTKRVYRYLLDGYFIALLTYWMSYVLLVWVRSGFRSYMEMYLAGAPLKNHHEPGVYISLATVYLAHRFFYREGRLALGGYLVFGFGLLGTLVLESRSNFLFTGLALLLALWRERRHLGRLALVGIPAVLAVVVVLDLASTTNKGIQQRFDVADLSYQQRSTDSRIRFVGEALQVLVQRPLGSGIRNIKLHIDDKRLLVHNQFLSFALAGGVIAILGLLLWGRDYYVTFRRMLDERLRRPDERYIAAPGMVIFAFYTTLITIELSGLLFFIVVSLGMYLSGVLALEYRNRRVAGLDRIRSAERVQRQLRRRVRDLHHGVSH